MLTSVLSPISIATPDTAPPWGWNPAATFLTAYNDQAKARRDQEEFQLKMQMEKILFPAKAAKAEFEINQLAYETENMANSYRLQNEMINERRRIIRNGGSGGSGGSGASSNVAGNGGSSNQAPARASNPYGFGLGNIAAPKTQQPPTQKKVSWKVVAPAQPQGTQGP